MSALDAAGQPIGPGDLAVILRSHDANHIGCFVTVGRAYRGLCIMRSGDIRDPGEDLFFIHGDHLPPSTFNASGGWVTTARSLLRISPSTDITQEHDEEVTA